MILKKSTEHQIKNKRYSLKTTLFTLKMCLLVVIIALIIGQLILVIVVVVVIIILRDLPKR